MMIKNYSMFIAENSNDIKFDLISFFDSNKGEIISRGIDYNTLKKDLEEVIMRLDKSFLEKINYDLKNINFENKSEFSKKFEEIIHSLTEQIYISSPQMESFEWIKRTWQSMKDGISSFVHWISDRIYTISGIVTMGLGGLLYLILGPNVPQEFKNIGVNIALVLGFTIFKYGQENDKYKNYSEK